jgi:hypothetical protein
MCGDSLPSASLNLRTSVLNLTTLISLYLLGGPKDALSALSSRIASNASESPRLRCFPDLRLLGLHQLMQLADTDVELCTGGFDDRATCRAIE